MVLLSYKYIVMKKFILMIFMLLSLASFACHTTSISLVSGPTSIGGGQYSTTIQVCFGQYTAGNWGGTQSFNIVLAGATYVSFSPVTITNTYKAYTTATCSGPNCFMGTCASVTATATGTLASSTMVSYNTTSSTPAGYPIVPDDNESCTGCPTSFCFNFTFVSNGYPTSISLTGNIEEVEPKVCRTTCGFPTNYAGGPCNGSFDADMTITFTPLPIELLYFNGYKNNGYNLLEWTSATEQNNDYYTIERSLDGFSWTEVAKVDGAGNSSQALRYTYRDYGYDATKINYYRLSQTDYNGQTEYFQIIAVENIYTSPSIMKVTDILGQDVPADYEGIRIIYYSNGRVEKKVGK
jgi:hypothetical protein